MQDIDNSPPRHTPEPVSQPAHVASIDTAQAESPMFQQQDSRVHVTEMGTYRYTSSPVQKMSSNPASSAAAVTGAASAQNNGTGLPEGLKAGMEHLSGLSMDNVRVHYHSVEPARIQAHAYAQGTDIHLGPGQERHLPHEAWHVVQQAQGRVRQTFQAKGWAINDDPGLEREADVMGDRALRLGRSESTLPGGGTAIRRGGPVVLQGVFTRHGEDLPDSLSPDFYQSLGQIIDRVYTTPHGFVEQMQQAADKGGRQDLVQWLTEQPLVLRSADDNPGLEALVQEAERTLVGASLRTALQTIGALSFALAESSGEVLFDSPLGPKIWMANPGPAIKGRTAPTLPTVPQSGRWYSREQLMLHLQQPSTKSLFSDVLKYIDLLGPGSRFSGNQELFAILSEVQNLEAGKKPMLPHYAIIKVAGFWYIREQLARLIGTPLSPGALKSIEKLPSGTQFVDKRALESELNGMALVQAKLEHDKAEKLRLQQEEEARKNEEELQRSKNPFTTSMAAHLPLSMTAEDAIGKQAAVHGRSLGAAAAMAAKVVAFIEAYDKLVPGQGAVLYGQIGSTDRRTSGAVGQDPVKVKRALESGTLQGRLTHILAFKAVFESLLQQNKAAAMQAAQTAGFDPRAIARIGTPDKAHDDLLTLKQDIVPRRGTLRSNSDTVAQVGIPFSPDERALWEDPDVPGFEIGHTNDAIKRDHPWAQQANAMGFPFRSGPSTHTAEIFESRELLGADAVSLEDTKLAAIGYLLPIGAHSLIEIQHTAEMFGADREMTPLLYQKIGAELGQGAVLAVKTGAALLKTLGGSLDAFDEGALIKAHHYLLTHGYAFMGFHGASAEGMKGITEGGFSEAFEKRKESDPWRGVYFAPHTGTAMGYMVKKEDRLLRVYAPVVLLKALVQARIPIDDPLSHNELAKRLKMGSFVPSSNPVIIMGRERSHADNDEEANSLEAVMSWAAAKQCIVLPSLHRKEAPSAQEMGLPNQLTVPSTLSFEGGEAAHSSGGLNLTQEASDTADPHTWKPSAGFVGHEGEWGAKKEGYVNSPSDREGPTRRQVEILKRLGIGVRFGMAWREIGALTLPLQVNAATLQEILPLIEHLHVDSPGWIDFVTRFTSAKDISTVLPGIYLSGWQAAMDTPWQKSHVGYVLNCCQFTFPEEKGITYDKVNVVGYNNGLFEWASSRIEAAKGKGVLVHCIEGKNRSATVLAAYLMQARRWDADKAIRYLTAQRPWAEPDRPALMKWETYLVKQGFFPAPIRPPASDKPKPELSSTAKTSSFLPSSSFSFEGTDWMLDWALQESLMESITKLSFVGTGHAIGLDQYLRLHNASGHYNNCLIYSIVGALGLTRTDQDVQRIGETVRAARVGVEHNGFLNAQAVPRILQELGYRDTEVVIIDTTGRVESRAAEGVDTYSAEIVNAGAGRQIFVVNQRYIHFGYGILRPGLRMDRMDQSTGDGNHWIRFLPTTRELTLRRPRATDSLLTSPSIPELSLPVARTIFGFSPTQLLTESEITKRYRLLALTYHPDRNKGNEEQSAEAFKRVVESFLILKGQKKAKKGKSKTVMDKPPDSGSDDPSGTGAQTCDGV